MYGSRYHGSNYYASNYYRPDVIEEADRGFAGGGGLTGRQRRLLKQIEREDEIVVAVVAAFIKLRE